MLSPYLKPIDDDEDVSDTFSQTKPLSELSVDEVTRLLESLNLSTFYCSLFKNTRTDGAVLFECKSVEELKELGIIETARARNMFNKITIFKVSGVPLELLSKVT